MTVPSMTGRIWDGMEQQNPSYLLMSLTGVLNIGAQHIIYVYGNAGVNKYGTINYIQHIILDTENKQLLSILYFLSLC